MEGALAQADPLHPRCGFYDGTYAVLRLRGPQAVAEILPDHLPDRRLL